MSPIPMEISIADVTGQNMAAQSDMKLAIASFLSFTT
jgi:hypothetical protein